MKTSNDTVPQTKNKDLIALTKQAVSGQEADTMVPFAALPKYAQDKLRG